ncbi:hypothetical protein CDAR_382561 [Caerostris darwini]|uniref:Uncharacterized protein n=1 Tax=Caerostris darwini TaxID=1538125 RepID=A0AAV4SL94_9ARAC|nr:hypothetical protein CDAR_382561 [Caerostris darwini]
MKFNGSNHGTTGLEPPFTEFETAIQFIVKDSNRQEPLQQISLITSLLKFNGSNMAPPSSNWGRTSWRHDSLVRSLLIHGSLELAQLDEVGRQLSCSRLR